MCKIAAEKIKYDVTTKYQSILEEIVARIRYSAEGGYFEVEFTLEYDYSVCSFLELEIGKNFFELSGYKCTQKKNGDFILSYSPSKLLTKYSSLHQ